MQPVQEFVQQVVENVEQVIGGKFKRIQFTPDLLPNNVTGVSVFNQQSSQFEFRPGPVFVSILLADVINRATPRTQSLLLEAMQEQQVTVEGVTHSLPRLFLVLASQNPIEYEGTFPLPEAQLDRFLMRLTVTRVPFSSAWTRFLRRINRMWPRRLNTLRTSSWKLATAGMRSGLSRPVWPGEPGI